MNNLCLVTGANGHLGNTLVRALLERGERVRAGVRDEGVERVDPLAGLVGVDVDVLGGESAGEQGIAVTSEGHGIPSTRPASGIAGLRGIGNERL